MNLLKQKLSPLCKLKDPGIVDFINDMFYHWNGGNFVIMLAVGKIIIYDLDKQIIKEEYEPPNQDDYMEFGCFDPQKNIIYMKSGHIKGGPSAFNLTTKEWIKLDLDDIPCPIYQTHTPRFFFIPSPINQTHFFLNGSQYLMLNNYDKKLLSSNIGSEHITFFGQMAFVYNSKKTTSDGSSA